MDELLGYSPCMSGRAMHADDRLLHFKAPRHCSASLTKWGLTTKPARRKVKYLSYIQVLAGKKKPKY